MPHKLMQRKNSNIKKIRSKKDLQELSKSCSNRGIRYLQTGLVYIGVNNCPEFIPNTRTKIRKYLGLNPVVHYDTFLLLPSLPFLFGVYSYIYFLKTHDDFIIESEVRDTEQPVASLSSKFKFCGLTVRKDSTLIYYEKNTYFAKDIYIHLNKMFAEQQR